MLHPPALNGPAEKSTGSPMLPATKPSLWKRVRGSSWRGSFLSVPNPAWGWVEQRQRAAGLKSMKYLSAILLLPVFWTALGSAPALSQQTSVRSTKKTLPKSAAVAEAVRQNNLGAAYMNQQQFERALKCFRQALALDPKLEIAKVNQGIALANLRKFESAGKILSAAVRANPNDPHAWYILGLVYKNQGESQESLR